MSCSRKMWSFQDRIRFPRCTSRREEESEAGTMETGVGVRGVRRTGGRAVAPAGPGPVYRGVRVHHCGAIHHPQRGEPSMKLQFAPDLPAERLILVLPGETARDLKLFQRYLAEEQQQQKDLKQIATTILEAFLEGVDGHCLAWKKWQDGKGD